MSLPLVALVGLLSNQAPQKYVVNPAASQLHVLVFRDGAAKALAHDHIIAATSFTGTITADPEALGEASVEITASANALVPDEPTLRTLYKLESVVSPADRETVTKNMKSDNQLDVAKFASISFKSTSLKPDGAKWLLSGLFTLHGVSKAMTMPITVRFVGEAKKRVEGEASFSLKPSDFGIKPFTALLGAIRNKDEVVVGVKLSANAP